MKRRKFLRHTWIEFRDTLVIPEPQDAMQDLRNASRPHEFFNASALGLEFEFRMFHALPSTFVGLGLLLTFLGLVSALYFATMGISESASVTKTQEELKGLLYAASFKFYTSISGLLASLLFVIALRWGGRSIDHACNDLSEHLESRLHFVTTESLALQQVQLTEQTNEQLVRLNTDIAVAIGQRVEEALNATLPMHLSKPLEELNSNIGSVAGNLSEINTQAVNEMGRAFNDELTQTTREQFDQLAGVLADLKSSLEGLGDRLSDSGSNLTQGIQVSTDEMRSAIDLLTDKVVHMASSLEENTSRSDEAMNQQIQALNERIGLVTKTLAESLESVGSSIMARTQAAAGEFAGQVAGAAGAFESASAVTAKRIEEAVTRVTQGAEAAGERVSAEIEESSLALRTVLQSAAGEFERIEHQIALHRDAIRSVSESAGQTSEAAQDAARSFRESSQPLRKIAQDMAKASHETRDKVSGLDDTMRTIQHQISETAKVLNRAAEISNSASSSPFLILIYKSVLPMYDVGPIPSRSRTWLDEQGAQHCSCRSRDREMLTTLSRSATATAREVTRAKVLLKYEAGLSITRIQREVGVSRPTIYKCVDKALAAGVRTGLRDRHHRPREPEILPDAKAWVVSVACQQPKELGLAAELWTLSALTAHVQCEAEAAGFPRLSRISRSRI